MKLKQATLSLTALLVVNTICPPQSFAIEPKGFFKPRFIDDDKKPAKKNKSSKSIATVKVVPDIIKKAMHITIKGDKEKEMDLFVFDMEGKLVLGYKVKGGDRITVSNLERGNYVYNVFYKDEAVATGKLQFR